MKKLHVLCNDGSPLHVTEASIFGKDHRLGVGGAELALLTMCRGWHDRGYDITLYNNPDNPEASAFRQKTLDEFVPHEERDYLIVFRSPNERAKQAKGRRIWWSCDQQTVGDFKDFSRYMEKIVTISPRHANYFRAMYGIDNTITIDLPVRTSDYEPNVVQKISKRCIYTSIPDRGATQLNAAWALIVRDEPEASLVLTSDWRLWDVNISENILTPYRLPFASQRNASYVGAVKRDKLIGYQLEADLLTYPCVYDELYCITVAEAQVAGAIPITSQFGALPTTNEFGIQIEGSPFEPAFIEKFVKATLDLLHDPYLRDRQEDMKKKAKERFALDRILDIWDERIFNG